MILIVKLITFVNIAALCLMTTSFQIRVSSLNGLYVEEIPKELSQLNSLGRQLVQRAKPFQTIIRLGTYTRKVPIYYATKGLKGTMFFLPFTFTKYH